MGAHRSPRIRLLQQSIEDLSASVDRDGLSTDFPVPSSRLFDAEGLPTRITIEYVGGVFRTCTDDDVTTGSHRKAFRAIN